MGVRRAKRCAWLWGIAALLASERSEAHAQAPADAASRDEARLLGQEGIEALWAEQFAVADAKLERAYALFPTPTLALWSARARQKLGRWVDAVARYRETIERSNEVGDNAAQQRAQLEAKTELEQLLPRLPSVVLSIAGRDIENVVVRMDGQAIPAVALGTRIPLDPGAHTFEASRADERYEQHSEPKEAEQVLATFSFSALPVAPPPASVAPAISPASAASPLVRQSPAAPISIAALATGGASLVASGVLAFVATNERADNCPRSECTSARARDEYDGLKAASAVTFYAGAALALGGLAGWLLLGPASPSAQDSVTWRISPAGASVAASY